MIKTEPVRTEDGEVESFVLTVAGKDFICECGCNCLHKPDNRNLKLFECNGCGRRYGSKF